MTAQVETQSYTQYFHDHQIIEWRSFYVHYEQHRQILNMLHIKIKNGLLMMEQYHDNIEQIQQRIRHDIVKVDDFFMIQLDLCYMMKDNYDKHRNIKSNTNLSTLMELIAKLFSLYEFVWHNFVAFMKLIQQMDVILNQIQITTKSVYEDEKLEMPTAAVSTAVTTPSASLLPVETPKTPDHEITYAVNNNNKYSNLQNELKNMKMMKKHSNVRETLDQTLTKFYENQSIQQNDYNKIQSIISQYNTNLARIISRNLLPKSISIYPWFYQYNQGSHSRGGGRLTPTVYSPEYSKHTTRTSTNTAHHTKITSIPSGEDIEYSEFNNNINISNYINIASVHVDRPITAKADRSHENLSDLWPDFSETRIHCNDGTDRSHRTRSNRTNRTRTDNLNNIKNLKIRTSLVTPNGFSPNTASQEVKSTNVDPYSYELSVPIPATHRLKCVKHYVVLALLMMLYGVCIGAYPFTLNVIFKDLYNVHNIALFAVLSSCQWPIWLILLVIVFIYDELTGLLTERLPLDAVYSGSNLQNHTQNNSHCAHAQCPMHPTVQSDISLFTVYRQHMNYCLRTKCTNGTDNTLNQNTCAAMFKFFWNKYGLQMILWIAFMDALQIVFDLIAMYSLNGIIYLCLTPLISFALHLLIIYPILGKHVWSQMFMLLACCSIQIALCYWYDADTDHAYDILWGTLSLVCCHILSSFKLYLIFNHVGFIEKDVSSSCNIEYFLTFSAVINILCFLFIIGCVMIMYDDTDYHQLFIVIPSQDNTIMFCLLMLIFSKVFIQMIKYMIFNRKNNNKLMFSLLNTNTDAYYNGDLVAASLLDFMSRTIWIIIFVVALNENISMKIIAAWVNICFVIYIGYKMMSNSLFSHGTFSWLTFIHSSYASLSPNNMDSILLSITYKFYSNFKLYINIAQLNNRNDAQLNTNAVQKNTDGVYRNRGNDKMENINDSVELSAINKTVNPSQTESIPTPVPTAEDSNDSVAL